MRDIATASEQIAHSSDHKRAQFVHNTRLKITTGCMLMICTDIIHVIL